MKQFRTPYFFRWIFHRRVWGFSRNSGIVYLTFDDGPTPECTNWIVDTLADKNIKATFFCVGANAQKHPELMERMQSEGHAIGNHTMRHEKGTKTSKKEYFESVAEAAEFIPSKLFRPPYGRIPMAFTKELRKKYDIIMWTWLSYDYHPEVSAAEILQRAQSIQSGDILVLHDNVKSFEKLKETLPQLLKIIEEKGLKFSVIS
ncbi:MAG: polysaccharide deacetylase family protein [Fluviicola sp. XM-24bin1]|nr:MAG: polysaccharide deacetylase family protein [Fluviicola sp. XM-24bin1]